MDIRLEVAFQEAMEEVNDLSKRLILERSIRKQLEEELNILKQRNEEIEGRLQEMERTLNFSEQQNE